MRAAATNLADTASLLTEVTNVFNPEEDLTVLNKFVEISAETTRGAEEKQAELEDELLRQRKAQATVLWAERQLALLDAAAAARKKKGGRSPSRSPTRTGSPTRPRSSPPRSRR